MDSERIKALKAKIKEKKDAITELKRQADMHNAFQLALKLIMNSSYGAFANKHFVCYSAGIASTITSHGRDLTKTMNDKTEWWWHNMFHKDMDLHEAVARHSKVIEYVYDNNLDLREFLQKDYSYEGVYNQEYDRVASSFEISDSDIPEIKQIPDNYIHKKTNIPFENPEYSDIYETGEAVREHATGIYCDTDSVFVGFKEAIKAYKWLHDPLELVLFMSFYRFEPFFKEELDKYAEGYGVENLQDFELEQISKSTINLAKKMYLKNVVWEEGVFNDPEKNLQPKGIDLVRSSSSPFSREKVKKLLNYFFENPDTYNDKELVKLVRDLKDEFMIAPIEDIAMGGSCNNYSKYVIDDNECLSLRGGTPHGVKAAALHNYILNQNPEFKNKYDRIKSGSKIKYYFTTNQLSNEFAFMSGEYPYELAEKYAPIDYDTQFQKSILNLLNRFAESLGLSEINSRMSYKISLF